MNVLRGLCLVGALGVAICSCGGGDKGAPAAQDSSDGTAASVTRDLDAGASDPEVAYAITMKIQSFTVPANSEAWKCQDFASPFDNKQVDVIGWDFEMTPGSHHMTLFNTPNATNGPLVDCLNGPGRDTSYAFGAQAAKAAFKFPDGVGETDPVRVGVHDQLSLRQRDLRVDPGSGVDQDTRREARRRHPALGRVRRGPLLDLRPANEREAGHGRLVVHDSAGHELARHIRAHARPRVTLRRNIRRKNAAPDRRSRRGPHLVCTRDAAQGGNGHHMVLRLRK